MMWTSDYGHNETWPYMEYEGRRYSCGDNYGDVECAFCDVVIAREHEEIADGHACWNCGVQVAGFWSGAERTAGATPARAAGSETAGRAPTPVSCDCSCHDVDDGEGEEE